MTKTNLFAAPKVKAPAKKTEDKKVVAAPELNKAIAQFNEIKNRMEADKAALAMLEGSIKAKGKEIYLREYKAAKVRPGSFKIADDSGAVVMFIATDKYTLVDEDKAEILKQYELLEERNTFKINPDLIDRYGEILSDLIINCPDIAEEDKGNLIQGELQYSVKKGSIDRLMQFDDMENVFELINPVCQLKK